MTPALTQAATRPPVLSVESLDAWYGHAHVVQNVGFEVLPGEAVAILGRNGAGKTSTLKAIMGLMPKSTGTVTFAGAAISRQPTHARYHLGLAFVPEDRRIVPGLTVRENIRLGLLASDKRVDEDKIIARLAQSFPRLGERLNQVAVSMSGGEQQMLSIARAMANEPSLILLDEPSEGVSPVLVDEMYALFQTLKSRGIALLLVEQEVDRALEIAARIVVLDQGRVVHATSAEDFRSDKAAQARWCAL